MGQYSTIFILSVFLTITSVISQSKDLNKLLVHDRLRNHLFLNYDPHSRPAKKGQVIELQVSIGLEHFTFQEKDGAFDFVGVLNILWYDPKLKWDPSEYNNITRLNIDQHVVWVPDFELYNNVAHNFFEMHKNGVLLLENTGRILWFDDIRMRIFCTPSMQNWPHDKHSCNLQLGSWIYNALDVDAKPAEHIDSFNFDNTELYSSQYKLINFSTARIETKYECCTEPYVTINYIIEFERRAAFATIFHSFAFSIVIFNLVAMSLPPGRKEKLWLNSLGLILVIGHLLYFANKTAKFARDTPYIVIFHSACLILITGHLLLSVFSLFILSTQFARSHVPGIITKILRNPIGHFLITEQSKKHIAQDDQSHSKFVDVKLFDDERNLISSNSYVEKWILFVHLIERVLLIIYTFSYFILGTICFT